MHVSILPSCNPPILQSWQALDAVRASTQVLSACLKRFTDTAPAALPFVARDAAADVASTTRVCRRGAAHARRPFRAARALPASTGAIDQQSRSGAPRGVRRLGARALLSSTPARLAHDPDRAVAGADRCHVLRRRRRANSARLNAFHMTGRVAAAFGVYLLAVNGVDHCARAADDRRLHCTSPPPPAYPCWPCWIPLTIPAVLQWLKAFRPQVMTVGALVRAGGSLRHPHDRASMYLEIVFALGVGRDGGEPRRQPTRPRRTGVRDAVAGGLRHHAHVHPVWPDCDGRRARLIGVMRRAPHGPGWRPSASSRC